MNVDKILKEYRQVLSAWQEMDGDLQNRIVQDMQNGYIHILYNGSNSCDTRLSNGQQDKVYNDVKSFEYYRMMKTCSRYFSGNLVDIMDTVQKSYERAVDADIMDIFKNGMTFKDQSNNTDVKEMMALRSSRIKGHILQDSPWIKESILKAVDDYLHMDIDPTAKQFLMDELRVDEEDFLKRVAYKIRDDYLTVDEKISIDGLAPNDVLFIRDADHKIHLECVLESHPHPNTMRTPQAYTINAQGEKRLRSLMDSWTKHVLGIGHLPENTMQGLSKKHVPVRISPEIVENTGEILDSNISHTLYNVSCMEEMMATFRNPDLAETYTLLLQDRLQGSIIAPVENGTENTLHQWEDVLHLPYSPQENYALKNVRAVHADLWRLQSKLEKMFDANFPVPIPDIASVIQATFKVDKRMEQVQWKREKDKGAVVFAGTEEGQERLVQSVDTHAASELR